MHGALIRRGSGRARRSRSIIIEPVDLPDATLATDIGLTVKVTGSAAIGDRSGDPVEKAAKPGPMALVSRPSGWRASAWGPSGRPGGAHRESALAAVARSTSGSVRRGLPQELLQGFRDESAFRIAK